MSKNMKRIARLSTEKYSAADALDGHSELTQILKRHLPPSTVALFAKPMEAGDGVIEWYSELGGQPVPVSELNAGEAAQVKRLLDERLDSIGQLATRLESQGADGQKQAALLRQAARYPDINTLYSLNGQPVLTFWGYGVRPPEPVTSAPDLNDASAAVPGESNLAPPVGPDAVVVDKKKRRRWWLWLLLALLLLGLLAALFCWLFCREEPSVPPLPAAIEAPLEPQKEAEPVAEPQPEPEAPIDVPPEPEPEPEPAPPAPPPPEPDPLDKLGQKVNAAQNDCLLLQRIQTSEPLLQKSDPRATALKKQISQTLEKNCKQKLIKEAKNLCPNERPKELAPELIIVFDASGSMDISLLASQAEIQQAGLATRELGRMGAMGQVLGAIAGAAVHERLTREPKRITAAKQATTTVVRQIPEDVNIGLVLIERCSSARSVGFFTPAQRGSLLAQLQAIRPVEGTPLADGIARAGQMLDGVNKESVMLVVSDGEESCGQDPCAVATRLARAKPYLKINVVDIMGTGAGNCLASATGGRVFTAKNVNELSLMTNQAAQDVLGPEHCQRR
jgi:hypothetical protein